MHITHSILAASTGLLLATTAVSATQCYTGVYTLMARGTGETQNASVLEGFASALKAAIPDSGSMEVQYWANNSFYDSVGVGATDAQQLMNDYHSQCPDGKMVIMGYSQGALVMSIALAGTNGHGLQYQAISGDVADAIAAVIQFGDPSRVLDQGTPAVASNGNHCQTDAPLKRTGQYYYAMQTFAARLDDYCAAADPICCDTGTNGAVHTQYWGTDTTDAVVEFVRDKLGDNETTGSSGAPTSTTAAAPTSTTSTASTSTASTASTSTAAAAPTSTAPTSTVVAANVSKTAVVAPTPAAEDSETTVASTTSKVKVSATPTSGAHGRIVGDGMLVTGSIGLLFLSVLCFL